MTEDQTPTNPAAELVAVVEDLVTRQRQILGALVATTHPLKNDVQAVLLGMRGVVTKLRNGAAEADATTPTNPDLREQLAAAIKAEDVLRGFDTRGEWYARFADAALSVVAPVLEGLRAELENANRANGELAAQVLEVLGENARLRSERDALSSLLRGMARWATKLRRGMRGHEARIAHLLSRPPASDQTPTTPIGSFSVLVCDEPELHKQPGQHDDECWIDAGLLNPPPSSVQGDTTPATPDDAAARHMADVTRHPRFAELYAQAAHNVHARDNHDQGDERAEAAVPAVHAEWDADGDFRSADCLAKGCPLCASSDWAKRQAPSSVQGDTTPTFAAYLLRQAAKAAREHGNELRADMFEMAATDHEGDDCPKGERAECMAVELARKALAEYATPAPSDTTEEA